MGSSICSLILSIKTKEAVIVRALVIAHQVRHARMVDVHPPQHLLIAVKVDFVHLVRRVNLKVGRWPFVQKTLVTVHVIVTLA